MFLLLGAKLQKKKVLPKIFNIFSTYIYKKTPKWLKICSIQAI